MLATTPFSTFTRTFSSPAEPQSQFDPSNAPLSSRSSHSTSNSYMSGALQPRSVNSVQGHSASARHQQQPQKYNSPSSSIFANSFLQPQSLYEPRLMQENIPEGDEQARGQAQSPRQALPCDAGAASKNSSVFAASALRRTTAPSLKPAEMREKRRNAFLGKVRDKREERRFETRGDDMLRREFIQQQREWEQQQALAAPPIPAFEEMGDMDEMLEDDVPVDDYDLPISQPIISPEPYSLPNHLHDQRNSLSNSPPRQRGAPEDDIDEFLKYEDGELQELLSYLPTTGSNYNEPPTDSQDGSLWSDDTDYDSLFSEAWASSQALSSLPSHAQNPAGGSATARQPFSEDTDMT